MLLSVQGGSDLGLFEINEAARLVGGRAPEANIIFGAVIDDALGDEVRVTVIAAGDGGGPTKRQDDRALGQVMGQATGQRPQARSRRRTTTTLCRPLSRPPLRPNRRSPRRTLGRFTFKCNPSLRLRLTSRSTARHSSPRRRCRRTRSSCRPNSRPVKPRSRRATTWTCPTSSSDLATRDPGPGRVPHSCAPSHGRRMPLSSLPAQAGLGH